MGPTLLVIVVQAITNKVILNQQLKVQAKQKKVNLEMRMNGLSKMNPVYI